MPVDRIVPLGNRLLVRPYQRPEKSGGGIIIPDSFRDDTSWHYYEFVKGPECRCSPTKEERECPWHGENGLGMDPDQLHEGAILKTRWKMPAEVVGMELEDGSRILFLDASHVEQVIIWR